MKTKGATPEQIADIHAALEASPVGDTFGREVPVTFDLVVS